MRFTHFNKLQIALSSFISYTGQVRVSLLTVFSYHNTVIEWVLLEEALRCVVAINVDLGQCIVGSRLLTSIMDTRL